VYSAYPSGYAPYTNRCAQQKKAHRTIKPILYTVPPQQRADASVTRNTSDLFYYCFTDNSSKIIILAAEFLTGDYPLLAAEPGFLVDALHPGIPFQVIFSSH
jgi:hypothetical protein